MSREMSFAAQAAQGIPNDPSLSSYFFVGSSGRQNGVSWTLISERGGHLADDM
jgi:hypothetical protein